jgi:hypothetical protein
VGLLPTLLLPLLLLLQVRGCSADLQELGNKYSQRLGICPDCMRVREKNITLHYIARSDT